MARVHLLVSAAGHDNASSNDRFSMSLIPFTMSQADGCLITITFMRVPPELLHYLVAKVVDDLHGYPSGGRFVKGARCVAVECCPSFFVDFRLERTTHLIKHAAEGLGGLMAIFCQPPTVSALPTNRELCTLEGNASLPFESTSESVFYLVHDRLIAG